MHAKATSPVTIGSSDAIYSVYDQDRVISSVGLSNGDNESPLRANRGALAMMSRAAQAIFGGATVVAPQVPDTW